MRWLGRAALVLVLVAMGCGTREGRQKAKMVVGVEARVKVIQAVRAQKPPAIDGKLDDACWQMAYPVTGFYKLMSNELAEQQSVGRICYDDTHLYIGMMCLMPEGAKPVGIPRHHDAQKVFSDEVVEIMLDPGRTQNDYYQLVLSAHNATFDASRAKGGTDEDDSWDGEWVGKAHVGDGFWSAELAVPFHNLGITPEIGSTWGINLCREAKKPNVNSAIGAEGIFNDATKFAVLKGLDVDFRPYLFQFGDDALRLDPTSVEPKAVLSTSIENLTGKKRRVRVERIFARQDGVEQTDSWELMLEPGEPFHLEYERAQIAPFVPGRRDNFYIRSAPQTRKIVVSDATTGTILALTKVRRPMRCEAMRIEADNPWRRESRTRKTAGVSARIHLFLPPEALVKGSLEATLTSRETGKAFATMATAPPGVRSPVDFRAKDVPWGAYDVSAVFRNAAGREIASSVAPAIVLPSGKQRVEVLNNLVSELANAKERGMLDAKEITFMNPRDGWVFVSGTATLGDGGRLAVSIDAAPETQDAIVLTGEGKKTGETMRRLPVGRHKAVLSLTGKCRLEQLVVRAIPELVYAQYGSNPHVREFGPYTGEFREKYVCPNVNTFVTSGGLLKTPSVINAWNHRGGKWLLHCGVPKGTDTEPLTVKQAATFVASTPGYASPLVHGSIADEFGNSQSFCHDYAMAVRRLKGTPGFETKQFYPYANHLYTGPEGRDLMQALIDTGSHIAWKRYLKEQPDEPSAREFLQQELVERARRYRELCPGSLDHIVVCFGNFSAPNEFLNTNPSANYKTYLDMQFNIVANDPVFWRTYGLMTYTASYADEETIRWCAHLFRHYGIEGKTERATGDPYDLKHVRNPDFEDDLEGWSVKPAEANSIRHVHQPGFGWLQGRYPRTEEGDKALLMVRSAKRPNVFTQEIRDLEPGRLYSFRMFTGDYRDMSKKEKHAVTLKLDNVTLIPEKCFTSVIANCYSHAHPPYDSTHKAWMNYHWRIFRAKARTARLTVTDWASDPSTSSGRAKPGGPIGQELMFNYISVQPYFWE